MANSIGIGNRIGSSSGSSWTHYWTTPYKVIYGAWMTKPSREIAILQEAMLHPIVDCGAWDILDWFVCLAGESEVESRLDWKTLSKSCVNVGTGNIWTSLKGIKGNGSGYLDSQFNPTTDGIHIGLNDCTYGFVSNIDSAGADQMEMGALNNVTDVLQLYSRFTNGNAYVKAHATAYLNAPTASRDGCYIAVRNALNAQKYYKDNFKIIDGAMNALAIPDKTIKLLASGSGTSKSQNELSFAFAGKGLSVIQVSVITSALQLYNDSVSYFFDA
jgi:hypothetical protein